MIELAYCVTTIIIAAIIASAVAHNNHLVNRRLIECNKDVNERRTKIAELDAKAIHMLTDGGKK